MPLTDEQIRDLLAGDLRKASSPRATNYEASPVARNPPQQFGPLVYVDKSGTCTHRGCGSPTYIQIRGRGYRCYPHALATMNRMWIEQEGLINLGLCTCRSGEVTQGHMHSNECALYKMDKELVVE